MTTFAKKHWNTWVIINAQFFSDLPNLFSYNKPKFSWDWNQQKPKKYLTRQTIPCVIYVTNRTDDAKIDHKIIVQTLSL